MLYDDSAYNVTVICFINNLCLLLSLACKASEQQIAYQTQRKSVEKDTWEVYVMFGMTAKQPLALLAILLLTFACRTDARQVETSDTVGSNQQTANALNESQDAYPPQCTRQDINKRLISPRRFAPFRIEGTSMLPNLPIGTLLLVDKDAYQQAVVNRGDLVMYQRPPNPDRTDLKRIVGLPGEHIVVASGEVVIDNLPLKEPYIRESPVYSGEWMLGQDEYFVLGDNRNLSSDSRAWGPLPLSSIIGKLHCVYYLPEAVGEVTPDSEAYPAPFNLADPYP
jgi:signal peptidase I